MKWICLACGKPWGDEEQWVKIKAWKPDEKEHVCLAGFGGCRAKRVVPMMDGLLSDYWNALAELDKEFPGVDGEYGTKRFELLEA